MPHEPERDQLLIRYLLGELASTESEELEDKYFVDGDLHDELVAIEDELIDAYIRGELAPSRRASFERRFLRSRERKSKIEFARVFTHYVDTRPALSPRVHASARATAQHEYGAFPQQSFRSTVWQSASAGISLWIKTPMLQMAFATLLLVLCSITVLVTHRKKGPEQEQVRKAADPKRAPETAVTNNRPAQPEVRNKERPPLKARKVIPLLAFSLTALNRASGAANDFQIPTGDYTVRLRMRVEGEPYPRYKAILETPEGRTIAKRWVYGRSQTNIYADFPSTLLIKGDYILRLKGVRKGRIEDVAGFAFRVDQPQAPTR